jgi:hypothetical protein
MKVRLTRVADGAILSVTLCHIITGTLPALLPSLLSGVVGKVNDLSCCRSAQCA